MTLSLSPQQLKQSTYIPLLSDKSLALKSYSTAKKITEVQLHNRSDHETLSMGQTEPTLLASSNIGHVTPDEEMSNLTPPSQVVLDLPSQAALRLTGDDEVASDSDPEADELSIKSATDLATTRLENLPTSSQVTTKNANATTAEQTPEQSSRAKHPGAKRARFDGILITTRPPPYHKRQRPRKQPRRAPTSDARVLSLVDALAHTFVANKHTEDLLADRHDDASTAPQTDMETTEAEDEQLQSNARLIHTLSKGRHVQSRVANVSEPNSEDAVPLPQDILLPSGRPVKRPKPIPYDSNSALIDAALETVEASIGWDAELDVITRDEDLVFSAPRARASPADVQMAVDEEVCTPVGNARPMSIEGNPQRGTLTPYLSRGVQFRQRLHAIFGENVTVRTNRVARPRPVDLDLFSLEDTDRVPSPSSSESIVSARSAASVEASADTSMDQPIPNQQNEVDSLMKPTFDASEEQMNDWIVALQRLIKGKVHVKDEELETLSIILAEIESIKDRLDEHLPMVSELRESIKQLSELNEIPFGDRNKLRQRAKNVFRTWPSANRPEAS